MRVVQGFEAVDPPLPASVLTIGNFDGVHLGHRRILQTCMGLREPRDTPVVAITFEPHPLTIVAPQRAPKRLTTPTEKVRHLATAGADVVVVGHSSERLLSMEAEDFARDILIRLFQPTHIVVGGDFGFGRGRRGNVDTLRRLAAQRGFAVTVAEPFHLELEGERHVVSSSLIRARLTAGRVDVAAECLGRPYALTGVVEHGDSRGAGLGFPTANLRVDDDLLVPVDGVYAGVGRIDAGAWPAAISVGHVPTFDGRVCRVEAFLLDFAGDLYGQSLRIEFHRFLREQCKFGSTAELAAQIERDVLEVRALQHGD